MTLIFKKPCIGCGRCCKEEVCEIGVRLFETEQLPCPALVYEDNRYWCGVVRHADIFEIDGLQGFLKLALGIGVGCDSSLTGASRHNPSVSLCIQLAIM